MDTPHLSRSTAAMFGLTASFLAAACVPDLGPPPTLPVPQDFATDRSFAVPETAWPDAAWWTAYGDDQLDQLIDAALASSPDMTIAQARLAQASAAEEQAGASLLPSLTADISGGPTEISRNEGFPASFKSFLPRGWHDNGEISATLTYRLDLLGKNRAALAAATSEAQAAHIDTAAARLVLSTSVASAYAELVRLSADLASAKDAVRVRRESSSLVRQRLARQLENEGAAAEAAAREAAAEADLEAVTGDIDRTRNALAALLGKGPDRGLEIALPVTPRVASFGVPPGVAADLVGRRPDVLAARLRAEAAAARIQVAHADFYPNVDLTLSDGLQAFDLQGLLTRDSLIGHVGPAVHLPIFGTGAIAGRYRESRAAYDEAVAIYDRTLVNALREVADAIVAQRSLSRQLVHTRGSLAAGETAYGIAKLRYQGGLSRYLDVLTAEDALLATRRAVTDLEARAFSQDVALVRALGGGFRGGA